MYGGMGRDFEAFNRTKKPAVGDQKISPTDIGEEEGVLQQCDDTHQNPVEVCPVKKHSDSVERSTLEDEWFRNERLS